MELIRIVKGVPEKVNYDERTARQMLEINPDRYKTMAEFELIKDEYVIEEDKKEKRGRKPKKEVEDIEIPEEPEEVEEKEE